MSTRISVVKTGRLGQKQRTRKALIEATRALVARGLNPTVEQAAQLAMISRATAYRYFSNQQEMLVAAHPEVDATSLLGPNPPASSAERLDKTVMGLAAIFLDAEGSYRAMLRLSLEPDPEARGDLPLRQGRRFIWIEEALEPVRKSLSTEQYRSLVNAIAASIGIEALVMLTDLAALTRSDAVEVMRWSAQALLQQALAEAELDGATPQSTGD